MARGAEANVGFVRHWSASHRFAETSQGHTPVAGGMAGLPPEICRT